MEKVLIVVMGGVGAAFVGFLIVLGVVVLRDDGADYDRINVNTQVMVDDAVRREVAKQEPAAPRKVYHRVGANYVSCFYTAVNMECFVLPEGFVPDDLPRDPTTLGKIP